jgi:hypothetical protein
MRESTYPFARPLALRIHQHLAQRLAARPDSTQNGPAPDAAAFEAIIDAGFWASLRREEGAYPTISLVYLPPDGPGARLILERPLPLVPEELTRLAPAVERPHIHLGVWRTGSDWTVWGTIRKLPPFCFVLEVTSPGVLVVKFSAAEETNKFVNFAVLESKHVKILNRDVALDPDSPALLDEILDPDSSDSTSTLTRLAASMRAHGHGGTLLVVPASSQTWRESFVEPVRYAVAPAFTKLADLMSTPSSERHSHKWPESLQRAVDAIAGLTAVDGATIITRQFDLLAFGAHIRRRDGAANVDQVLLIEPHENSSPVVVHVSALGGTRHLSAVQFVRDQKNAVALVASQDGRFTVFSWSPRHCLVQAHRIDAFLL